MLSARGVDSGKGRTFQTKEILVKEVTQVNCGKLWERYE